MSQGLTFIISGVIIYPKLNSFDTKIICYISTDFFRCHILYSKVKG